MTRFSSLVAIAAVATVTSDALVPGADAAPAPAPARLELSPKLLVGTWKCEINGALYGQELINAVAEAGGTDSLGVPGSEAWSEVLREATRLQATLTGVEITYIVPAFEWLDEEETQGLFVIERLYTKVPEGAPTPLDVPMLYPGIVALNPLTGEYVVKVAETDDNSIMEIWLESPDTFLKIYTEAGTLDVEGNTLFPNIKAQTPLVATDRCRRV